MKKAFLGIFLVIFLSHSAYALSVGEVQNKVNKIQSIAPAGTPSAPGDYDQKGFVGEVLAEIFTNTGKVKSEFINALKNILPLDNNVPKWSDNMFQEGTIWDDNGNIGIGNPNPTKKLDIAGDINFTGDIYKNGDLFASNGAGGKFINGTNPDDAVYKKGRVGIGIDVPEQQLHTTGTVRFDGGVQIDGIPSISANNVYHRAQPSLASNFTNYGFFEMRNKAGDVGAYIGGGNGEDRIDLMLRSSDKFFIGNESGVTPLVGIGEQEPKSALHVAGNIISNDPIENNHLTTKGYVDNLVNNVNTSGKFVDGVNTFDAVYTNGKVGIGLNNPVNQLHTSGTVRFDGGIMIDGSSAISATNASHTARHEKYGYFEGRNDRNERGFYLGLGNGGDRVNFVLEKASKLYMAGADVGIGTPDPSEKLEVIGNIKANGYLYSSDATLKHNIQTTSGLSTILQLRGVDFVWNATHKEDTGFIAQEIELVLPQLVQTDKNSGLKSVNYANIVAPLVEAVKEQQTRIDHLESEIKLLQR